MAHDKMLTFTNGSSKTKSGTLPLHGQDVEACMTTAVELGGRRPTERKSSRSWSLQNQLLAVLGSKAPLDAGKKSDDAMVMTTAGTRHGKKRCSKATRLLVLGLVVLSIRRILVPMFEALCDVAWCARFPSLGGTGMCTTAHPPVHTFDAHANAGPKVPESLGPQESLATLLVSLRAESRTFPRELLRSAHALSGLALDVEATADPASPLARELAAFAAHVSQATTPLRTLVPKVQEAGRAIISADEAMSLQLGGIAHAASAAAGPWWWVDGGELAHFVNVFRAYHGPRLRALLAVVDAHVGLLDANIAVVEDALAAATTALKWLNMLAEDADRISGVAEKESEKTLLVDLASHRAAALALVSRIKTDLEGIRVALAELHADAVMPKDTLRRQPVVQGLVERNLIGWNELLRREMAIVGSSLEGDGVQGDEQ